MKNRIQFLGLVCGLLFTFAGYTEIPRTSDGKPDLSGTYNIATITPVERPVEFGTTLTLSRELARQNEAGIAAFKAAGLQKSDSEREAPPAGGDGSAGPSGNVGGYNFFWIDAGDTAIKINGEYRTSIITDPPNGRYPEMTPAGGKKLAKFFGDVLHENKGDAWWLNQIEPGPYDDPERLTLSDRCLLGFGSTGGPPMLPTGYNNLKRIVQTPDYVVILIEMVHDARVIRLNSEHQDPSIRRWLGDSIGWWEGDTLVVDTINFPDQPSLYGASRDLHVVEKFKRTDENTLLYSFTVDDPTSWSAPWSGEYPWPQSDTPVYEYACHEGNYAMEGILKGARILENEKMGAGNPGSE